jgi:hypothetical protein
MRLAASILHGENRIASDARSIILAFYRGYSCVFMKMLLRRSSPPNATMIVLRP